MSENPYKEDWTLQWSVKSPKGDMLNIRARGTGEMEAILNGLLRGEILELADAVATQVNAVANASAALGAQPVAQVPADAPTWVPRPETPQQVPIAPPYEQQVQQQPVAQAGPPCNHGTRTFKTGITKSGPKTGQSWSAWMCAAPKGTPGQCEPIWA